jgi:hypothetical protein
VVLFITSSAASCDLGEGAVVREGAVGEPSESEFVGDEMSPLFIADDDRPMRGRVKVVQLHQG